MEREVVEFDLGSGAGGRELDDDGVDIDYSTDDENMIDSGSGKVYLPEGDVSHLEPCEGMEFESEEAAKAFYNSYARRVGFSTRVNWSRRLKQNGAIIQRQFVCAKEGFSKPDVKRKRERINARTGCKATVFIKMQDSGKWVVNGFVREHNHEMVPPDQVHCLRSHRLISGPAKTLIDTLQAAGLGPKKVMTALIKKYGGISKVGFTQTDCKNYMGSKRKRAFGGDFQLLLDYLRQMQAENPNFFFAVQDDEDQSFNNVFWFDFRARLNYTYFGDTVTFDTTYRSDRYRVPFAPFTGVNHHGQPVLFGCAFVMNESEASFRWLFNMWLTAMAGRAPASITTDHDPVIGSAIAHVFPESRHRFCKWHIFKQCQEKLSHMFLEHPNFEADLHKCVNLSESIDEFESCWLALINRYDLRDHEWLHTIYSSRRQWVPVYLRDTFFAEMSITQRSDRTNSYFDGFINFNTNSNHFFKKYENALESRNEKEMKADYDTMNTSPVLKTPSPMEKQASEIYTRKLFTRFQEELVGTLTYMASKTEDDNEIITYRVSKYGEDHRAYFVRFNVLEMKAACSCQMFEFSGLLCRHVLTVFRVTNVLTLPPHYILKRWTRHAKSSLTLEEHIGSVYTNYLKSHTVRYNTLRREAFKFVDEGVESVDVYGVAMAALREAAEKVSAAAKNDGRTEMLNGCVREKSAGDGSSTNQPTNNGRTTSDNTSFEDDMDRKIRDLTNGLQAAKRKCEVYRSNLLSVLKDMEVHKLQVSINVQNVKSSL